MGVDQHRGGRCFASNQGKAVVCNRGVLRGMCSFGTGVQCFNRTSCTWAGCGLIP